jgi:hypothetical protein
MKPRLSFTSTFSALLVFATACGDNSSNDPDARMGMPDSMITPGLDAMPDGAPPAPPTAKVTVQFRGAPAQGASVAFHDATGAVTDYATTAADGSAEGEIGAGGMITVGVAETVGLQENRILTTVYGVADGDDLLVELLRPADTSADFDAIVRFFSFPTANSYQVCSCPNTYFVDPIPDGAGPGIDTGCEVALSDQTIQIKDECLDDAGLGAYMVVAKDGVNGNGNIVAFGGLKGLTDNQFPNPAPMLTAPDPEMVTMSNLPMPLPGQDMVFAQLLGGWYTNGAGVGNGYAFGLSAAGGNVTATMDAPGPPFNNFYDFAINNFSATLSADAGPRNVYVAIQAKGVYPGPLTADFSTALPAIDDVSIDYGSLPALEASWTSTGSLSGADGGRVSFTSQTLNLTGWSWDAVVPSSATSVIFPTLPTEMAAFNPPDDGRQYLVKTIVMLESSAAASYADLRTDWNRYLALDPRGSETVRTSFSEAK